MPRLIVPETRIEVVVDAMLVLLARDGPAGLTVRAIARECRLSAASILHQFESRRRLLVIGVHHIGRARLEAIERRSPRNGIAAFLPAPGDDEDLITARAWLGCLELWRSEDALTDTVDAIRGREILILARVLGVRAGGHDLTVVRALVDGLTVAVCEPIRPLPPARAREILADHVAATPAFGAPAES